MGSKDVETRHGCRMQRTTQCFEKHIGISSVVPLPLISYHDAESTPD